MAGDELSGAPPACARSQPPPEPPGAAFRASHNSSPAESQLSAGSSQQSVSTQTSPAPGGGRLRQVTGEGAGSGRSTATQTSPPADERMTTTSSLESFGTPSPRLPTPSFDLRFNQKFSGPPIGGSLGDAPLFASPGRGSSPGSAGAPGTPLPPPSPAGLEGPVELIVTNLDLSRSPRDVERQLLELASQHAQVDGCHVYTQCDGSYVGTLTARTVFDSQLLVAALHRAPLGSKRLQLASCRASREEPHVVRWQVTRLLADVPSGRLPLVKFMELYEQRFHSAVSIADLYRMREAVTVHVTDSGRSIQLNPHWKPHPQPSALDASVSTCLRHPPQRGASVAWAELDDPSLLPDSDIALEELEPLLHRLLYTHGGLVHLNSLLDCHAAVSGDPALSQLRLQPQAVCLEHLISCVQEVRIVARGPHKILLWARDAPTATPPPVHPSLLTKVQLLSREVVDLLRAAPRARMPFNKFIPAYHNHFGRQCRVSEYGFTRLADLFDVLPHIIQILGCGHRRQITLTPRAQQRRFTSDLLRLLKSQPGKLLTVDGIAAAFQEGTGRAFSVWDYGATRLTRLLMTINGESVVVYRQQGELRVAIPRREQTPDEIQRTRQFADEVRQLLRHVPFCQLQFNKFIPAYHHHFGRQCKVSAYGFSKLTELLEAVADTAEVVAGDDGEKLIRLTQPALKQVLVAQITTLITNAGVESVPLAELPALFVREFGHRLWPELVGAASLPQLLEQLRGGLQLLGTPERPRVGLVNQRSARATAISVRALLMQQKSGALPLEKLQEEYQRQYRKPLHPDVLTDQLQNIVAVEGGTVRLLPLQLLGRDLIGLLRRRGGRVAVGNLATAFLAEFGAPVRPAQFGQHSLEQLLLAMADTVYLTGRGAQRTVHLLPEFVEDGATVGSPAGGGGGTAAVAPSGPPLPPAPDSRLRPGRGGDTRRNFPPLQVQQMGAPSPLSWGATWVQWGGWSPQQAPPPAHAAGAAYAARAAVRPDDGYVLLACAPAPSTLPMPRISWLPPPPPPPLLLPSAGVLPAPAQSAAAAPLLPSAGVLPAPVQSAAAAPLLPSAAPFAVAAPQPDGVLSTLSAAGVASESVAESVEMSEGTLAPSMEERAPPELKLLSPAALTSSGFGGTSTAVKHASDLLAGASAAMATLSVGRAAGTSGGAAAAPEGAAGAEGGQSARSPPAAERRSSRGRSRIAAQFPASPSSPGT